MSDYDGFNLFQSVLKFELDGDSLVPQELMSRHQINPIISSFFKSKAAIRVPWEEQSQLKKDDKKQGLLIISRLQIDVNAMIWHQHTTVSP